VSTAAERAVDVAATGTRRNRLDDLVEHDGNVLGHLTTHVVRRPFESLMEHGGTALAATLS
jgi:hypothetical protein